LSADLTELKLGSLTLTPTFAASTTSYTAATTNSTNKLTVTTKSETAEVVVKLGDDAVTAGSDGKYEFTWELGENTVTVKVTDGTESKTYTLTVTKS